MLASLQHILQAPLSDLVGADVSVLSLHHILLPGRAEGIGALGADALQLLIENAGRAVARVLG